MFNPMPKVVDDTGAKLLLHQSYPRSEQQGHGRGISALEIILRRNEIIP